MRKMFFVLLAVFVVRAMNPVQGSLAYAQEKIAEFPFPASEEAMFWGEEEKIISATKYIKRLREAPAIATVITAEQIRNMGARNLLDVLKTVPGFEITTSDIGRKAIHVRGIKTVASEKIRLMLDGHEVNEPTTAGLAWSFDNMPIENIKRIEVIRGPGSALYGTNAFLAVINVVTKDVGDIEGTRLSVSGGSFNTQKYNIVSGYRLGDLNITGFLNYYDTGGERLRVDKDVIGNSGSTLDYERRFDGDLKLIFKDFVLKGKYISAKRGPYIGVGDALNDESEITTVQYFGELDYIHSYEHVDVVAKVYLDEFDWDAFWEVYPEGFKLAGVIPFPDGFLGHPYLKEGKTGAEVQFDFIPIEKNKASFGFAYEGIRQYDVRSENNFNPFTFAPLGSIQDTTSWGNWNQNRERYVRAIYFQDAHTISDALEITAGVRYDDYSDFGNTTNIRGGMVYKFSRDGEFKFLYGEAFRAPVFEEMYIINNPAILGNEKLKAEKIRTYEGGLGFRLFDKLNAGINYFYSDIGDLIQQAAQPSGAKKYENTTGATASGIEAELKGRLNDNSYAFANYTYQESQYKDTNEKIPDVAKHKGNIGLNIGLSKFISINANTLLIGPRGRTSGDSRGDLKGQSVTNLTVIGKDFYKGLEIRGSAYNIFNENYTDPSPKGTVPGDFPRAGINFIVEAAYQF
ncbi:MAG: TonB-dependent receptor [Nitrospirae bacterium]|nr:TonB-dependent receptor [Nitrospirota bacterium]